MFQDIDPEVLEAVNLVENEYQDFFRKKLEEYGVSSPNELDYEKAQEFFNDIKKNWHGTNESVEEDDEEKINEGVEDVYSAAYEHLVNPSTLGVGDVVSFPYSGYNTEFKIELIVNPNCFGQPAIYHVKALNGPFEGEEMAFEESYVLGLNEEEDTEDEMNRVVEAINNEEDFESTDEDSEDEEIEIEDNTEDEEIEINESVDFDMTKENDDKLEEILKMFLKDKATDGEDYEIISKGNKLILRVNNKKYINNVDQIIKGE